MYPWPARTKGTVLVSIVERSSAGLLLAFCRFLLLAQVFAGCLIDHLHRQPYLAAVVEAEQLDLHRIAFFHDVAGLADALGRQLGNVDEAVLRAEEVHEGTEIHHLDDFAVVDFADLRLRHDGLDPFERGADRLPVRRCDLHGAAVLDVDFAPVFSTISRITLPP